MIRTLFFLLFFALVCSLSFGQYETQLIKKFAYGVLAQQLTSGTDRLYFISKDEDGQKAIFVSDINSDEAYLYYKHQTINSNSDINILFADANYLYFSGRKQYVEDNRPYLHRVSHDGNIVELITDEVVFDDSYGEQFAILGNKVVFRGRTLEAQPQKYYYSFDLELNVVTPLIHINNTYDYISKMIHHADGLLYISLRLTNTNDFHDFVTDGTLEGTKRFMDPMGSNGASSIDFMYSVGGRLYFNYKWNGEYLGIHRTLGFGQSIEPFSFVEPVGSVFQPYLILDDKFITYYVAPDEMDLRQVEIDMITGEFIECHIYEDYFQENDYTEVKPYAFENRSLLIRKSNMSKHQGFIEDCSQGQPYELPFNHGEPFEMLHVNEVKAAGGALYIAGSFNLENESQNQNAIIRIKHADLSVKTVYQHEISLFPNPANDQLTISSEEQTEISIFNTTGKLIYTTSIAIGNNQINLNDFQNGIYLVKLSNGKSAKFLKW